MAMIEVELYLSHPDLAFSDRDPNDPLSGWRFLGAGAVVDLPSVGDQICIAPRQAVRVRGVMHLARMEMGGPTAEPRVRLMVDLLEGSEFVGPGL
jgi:hypothetical protein